jgi:hypothetical protein
MKEFNVKVESTNDMRVVEREKAIKEAKRQIKNLLDQGYSKNQIFVVFHHEITHEYLGSMETDGKDIIFGNDIDNRLLTIKALLN